jgi:hypothetical protein
MKNPPRLILCVDQAVKSGWCIIGMPANTPWHLVDFGIATTFAARRTVLVQLLELMQQRGLTPSDVRLVLEDHSHVPVIKGRGTGVLVGMGKAYGRWEEQWLFAGLVRDYVHSVAPKEWRGLVLNTNKGGDVARALARKHVLEVLGINADADAAEAMCIGLWSVQHLERVLRGEPAPKKPRAKRRKAAA